MKEWLKRRGRICGYDQYAMNEQDVAFARYDPDRIAEELVRTGADIVVVTLWEQQARNRTIIHLADHTQSATDISRITEIAPVHDIELAVKGSPQNPSVTCRNGTASWAAEGELIRIRVPKLDSYAAVIIEPPA